LAAAYIHHVHRTVSAEQEIEPCDHHHAHEASQHDETVVTHQGAEQPRRHSGING
jgi:hypothetical protein